MAGPDVSVREHDSRGGDTPRSAAALVAATDRGAAAALERAAARLAAAGIEQPRREARMLLAHALGRRAGALLQAGRIAEPIGFGAMVDRRAAREPMAYITGRQGFWTLDLAVTPATLIPRADSETLIEAARDAAPDHVDTILDLGTGSGALLLAALVVFPQAWGVGVDRSIDALTIARANAHTNGLGGRTAFAALDWGRSLAGRFDVILANPPYIPTGVIPTLMPEVSEYEALAALDGGPDGLDCYRVIVPQLHGLLAAHGIAVLEIGADQACAVSELGRASGFRGPVLHRDLGGNARAVVLGSEARKKSVGISRPDG